MAKTAVQQYVTRLFVRARLTSGGGIAINIHGWSGQWAAFAPIGGCYCREAINVYVCLAAKLEISATLLQLQVWVQVDCNLAIAKIFSAIQLVYPAH